MTLPDPRRILITGASSGIGAALAVRYARSGRDLMLIGRDGARLRSVALQCTARGATVHYICADVRDADLLHEWIVDQDKRDPIDLVVANAGVSGGPRDGLESAVQIKTIFDINVQGVMNTITPLAPRMVARKRGQIAIVSSLAGFAPWPGAPAYAASKAAATTYGLALRMAVAAHGVAVSVITPGFIDTPLTQVNPYRMPWLMDVDVAAEKIEAGLARGRAIIAFPWQASLVTRLLRILPFSVQRILLSGAPSKPGFTPENTP